MASEAVASKQPDAKAAPVPAPGGPGAAPEAVQVRYKLELLATIKVAQQQNGLRHQDYQRYRQYCSRRIRRLRKQLGLLHPRKEFKKRPIEPKHVTDAKVLTLPLLAAERAWAFAMQIKADAAEEKDNTRLKFHLLRRLKKAARHAADLAALCSTCGDARAQLDAEAYSAWMQANVLFEQNMFPNALQKFVASKTVYENLAKSVDRATQLLCEERVASLEPSIKYCKMVIAQTGGGAKAADAATLAGSAGASDAILRAKLEHVLDETRKEQAKSLERVAWQGGQWVVDSEKLRVKFVEIKELVAKFADKEAKSAADLKAASSPRVKGGAAKDAKDAKGGDAKDAKQRAVGGPGGAGGAESDSDHEGDGDTPNALYVQLLSCYDEASNLIRDELKELKKGGDTAHSKEKETALNALRAYVAFHKLRATGDRNLIMAEHTARSFRQQLADDARLKEEAAAAAAAAAANKQAKKLTKKQKADAKKAAAAAAGAAAADSKAADAKDAKTGAAAAATTTASASSSGAATAADATAAAADGAKQKAKAAAAAHKQQLQKKRVKPDDVVVLYEKLIQNATELAELVTADKPLAAQLAARTAAYKAYRCLYLAESYRAIAKWAEAYALYSRTQQLVGAATPLLTAALGAAAAAEVSGLQEVNRLAGSAQAVVHATGVLEHTDKTRAASKAAASAVAGSSSAAAAAAAAADEKGKKQRAATRPLLERLNEFEAGDAAAAHNLVSFPPNFQAVPCKPTLFDLAFNGVAYPNIDGRIKAKPAAAAATAAAAAPAASSSKGFLSRLFGR